MWQLVDVLVGAGVIALLASPSGRLSRTFAFTALWYALFLFTLFDYHTSRLFVPLFHLAYAIGPLGCFILPLRLPETACPVRLGNELRRGTHRLEQFGHQLVLLLFRTSLGDRQAKLSH